MTVKSSQIAATARAWVVGIIGCLSTEWMHPAPDLQHPLCLLVCLVTSCGALWNENAAQAWARVPVHWTKHHAPMTVKSSHLAATARAWAVGIIGCLSTEWMHPAPDLQHPLCLLVCLVTSCGAVWNANAAQAWARVPVHWTKHHAPMTVKS